MKKIYSIAMLLLMVFSVAAQDKPTVCIENFINNSDLNNQYAKQLYNEIVSGLSKSSRIIIVQTSSFGKLPKDPTAYEDALMAEGVNYLLKGTVDGYTAGRGKGFLTDKIYDQCEIKYTLTLIDIETHQTLSSEAMSCSYTLGSSASEAISKAIEEASGDMKKYVNRHFKVNAKVKAIDQVDSKQRAKTLYVTMGSSSGVTKGDVLEVFAEVNIAGEKAKKKIGEVKVTEIMSATLSQCEVKSGGAEIKVAFDKGSTLSVVTRVK